VQRVKQLSMAHPGNMMRSIIKPGLFLGNY